MYLKSSAGVSPGSGTEVRADTGRFVTTCKQDLVRICLVTDTNQLKLKRGTRRYEGRCCFGIKWGKKCVRDV